MAGPNKYSTLPPIVAQVPHRLQSTRSTCCSIVQYHRLHLSSTARYVQLETPRLLESLPRRKHASRISLLLSKVRRCHGWAEQNLFVLWSCTYLLISLFNFFFAASIFFFFLKAHGDCDDAGKTKEAGKGADEFNEIKNEKKILHLAEP